MASRQLPGSWILLYSQAGSLPRLPDGWADRVVTTALSSGDTDLLVTLAKRADLGVDVVERLAVVTDPQVRLAVIVSPSATDDLRNRLLAGESRTAVLAPLLKTHPALALSRSSAVLADKPTVGLAKALLAIALPSGDDAPVLAPGTAELALATIVEKSPKLDADACWTVQRWAELFAQRNPELALKAFSTIDRPYLGISMLEHAGVSADARLALLGAWNALPLAAFKKASCLHESALMLQSAGDAQPEVVAALSDLLDELRAAFERADQIRRVELAIDACAGVADLDSLREQAALGDTVAVTALLAHPEVPDQEKHALLDGLTRFPRGVERVWSSFDADLLERLAAHDPALFARLGGLELLDGDAGSGRRVLGLIATRAECAANLPRGRADGGRSVQWVLRAAPELFAELAWTEVAAAATGWHLQSDELSVSTMIAEATARLEPQEWATFLSLAEDWQGSVGDLLAAARQL